MIKHYSTTPGALGAEQRVGRELHKCDYCGAILAPSRRLYRSTTTTGTVLELCTRCADKIEWAGIALAVRAAEEYLERPGVACRRPASAIAIESRGGQPPCTNRGVEDTRTGGAV